MSDWKSTKEKINPAWQDWYKKMCRDKMEREKRELIGLIKYWCDQKNVDMAVMNKRIAQVDEYDRVEMGNVLSKARKACRWME